MKAPPRTVLWLVLIVLLGCSDRSETRQEQPAAEPSAEPSSGAWPQWRGPGGLGISTQSPLASNWPAGGGGVRWKTPVAGVGNSSPIAVGHRVFLTTTVRKEESLADHDVLAFDLTSGALLFRTTVFSGPKYRVHQHNTNASRTPASDGTHLYVLFESVLAALNLDGEIQWSREIDPLYGAYAHWGSGSSPVVFEDLVIVFQDTEKASSDKDGWLAAFQRSTGEEVWRQSWRDTCCSYSTPLLWRRGDVVDLVVAHSSWVRAYDPRTGQPRWSHPYEINQFVTSPVASDDVVCTLGGAHNIKGNTCFRVTGPAGEPVVEQLWWDIEAVPSDSSPVLYEEKLFAVTVNGIMSAFDPVTGRVIWQTRLDSKGHHASLLAGDGKIFAFSSWGRMIVVDARSEQFTLLGDYDLGEDAEYTSPAIADGCLLVRTKQNLVCLDATAGASPSGTEAQSSG